MSCLIIGDGPSKSLIHLRTKYNVDAIICVHKPIHRFTKYVCSADIVRWQDKEFRAVKKKIPLIIEKRCYRESLNILFNFATLFESDFYFNSGAFAIDWAIHKGYKIIYTAGIDFYSPEKEYIKPERLQQINNHILQCDAKIFKVDVVSKLACSVEMPSVKN